MSVLTKDNETGLLSWSTMVLAMNMAGSFCYRTVGRRGTVGEQSPQSNQRTYSQQLRYSNLIFLWGVFTCLLRVSCALLMIRIVTPKLMKPDIASMSITYCFITWTLVGAIIPAILLTRSGQLANILEYRMYTSSSLEEEDRQEDIQVPTVFKRFKKISNWMTVIALIGFNIFAMCYSIYIVEMNTVGEMIIFGFFCCIYITGIFANLELDKSFFKLLSTQLVTNAKFSLHILIQETQMTHELVEPSVNVINKSLHRMKLQVRSVSTERVCMYFCRHTIYCLYICITKILPI